MEGRVKPRPSIRSRSFPALASPHLPCFDRRRGLAAARDLRRGELVLRAPRAALLTSDRVTADDPRIAACVSAYRPRLSSVQVNTAAISRCGGNGTCSCQAALDVTRNWDKWLLGLSSAF
jgi:hypothetical protein